MPDRAERPVALIVDDDLSYCVFMRQTLEPAGFSVIMESNGRLALRRLEEHEVALLVTDLFIPEIEGLELIELARRASPATRIVAVSGGFSSGSSGYLRVARLFGAHAVLKKPFSGSELLVAARPEEIGLATGD